MQYKKVEDGYLIRLDRGEEIVDTLIGFVRREKIPGGFITGIGAVEKATLGIYDIHAGSYITKSFGDRLEISNLTGNITYDEESGEPFLHCHITLADSSLRTFSGHLFEAVVLVTAEIYIRTIKEKMFRKKDIESGFNLWRL
jgi:uncharacterized protein